MHSYPFGLLVRYSSRRLLGFCPECTTQKQAALSAVAVTCYSANQAKKADESRVTRNRVSASSPFSRLLGLPQATTTVFCRFSHTASFATPVAMSSSRGGETSTSSAASSSAGSTRLVDVGCFILRGDGLLIADPLSVGGTLDTAMTAGGGWARLFVQPEVGPSQRRSLDLQKTARSSDLSCLFLRAVSPSTTWPQDCGGVLADVERMQPIGGGCSAAPGAGGALSDSSGDDFSLLMDAGSSVNVLFLLNSAHMQMQQAELSVLQGLPWEPFESPRGNRVYVSSGQVGVFTTHSMTDAQEAVSRASPQAAQAQTALWYNRACELTCSEHQVGILDVAGGPVGCVSATGISEEGRYPIYVARSPESEEIWAVKVAFLSS